MADPPSLKEATKRNKEIEQFLKRERYQYLQQQREPKLLILGTSDSGKSTLVKQLKILHGEGFTDIEKQQGKEDIISNVMHSAKNSRRMQGSSTAQS